MAVKKNALRKHFVAAYTDVKTEPTSWLRLAKKISDITDDTDETVEENTWYDSDGTPVSEVEAIAEKWSVSGQYDADDAAQALIAGMKRKIGDDRKIWHKIEQTDGKTYQGVATATEIKAGTGEASGYEEFSCTLNFDEIPKEKVTP